jgi:Protein of unknown function (DUF3632)
MRRNKSATTSMTDAAISEADEIDEESTQRNWWVPDRDDAGYQSVEAYMSGLLNLESTVAAITERINMAYSSADFSQPVLPASDIPANVDVRYTTGIMLRELWYSILHMSRKIPWRDSAAQDRLLDLVLTLKAHPDPPEPDPMPAALEDHWRSSDGIWSGLKCFNLAASDFWNDVPNRPDPEGFSTPLIHAWTNINAFAAILTRSGLARFEWQAIRAMQNALEIRFRFHKARIQPISVAAQLDADVPAAAVWVLVLGRELWESGKDQSSKSTDQDNLPKTKALWQGYPDEFSRERFAFWAERFKSMCLTEDLKLETRAIAFEAHEKMEEIMQADS